MPHARTTIRNALTAAFSSLTFTVHTERRRRVDTTLRPLAVMALNAVENESSERAMGSPYEVEHRQTVLIELHADGATGLEVSETIDAMELEIEQALAADVSLGGVAENIEPAGSEVESNDEQDRVLMVRSCTYEVTWRAAFGAPDSPEG